MGDVPASPEGYSAPVRLFLECRVDGEITWMNDAARLVIGSTSNLLASVPTGQREAARNLLAPSALSRTASLTCGEEPVTVHFLRLLVARDHLLLTGTVAEKVPSMSENAEALLEMQRNAVRNYFRLLQAQELLEARHRPARASGEVLAEELERERARIARELHASAGQSLAGIKLNLELIHSTLTELPESARGSLERIRLLAEQALSQIRAVSQRLHPPDWQQLGLADAIEVLWNTTGIPGKFRARLDVRPFTTEPSHAVRVAVYRSCQEGISNILRHAAATEVRLRLEHRDGRVHLTLEDNGKGFDIEQFFSPKPSLAARGIGVRSVISQVRALNGDLSIRSGPRGTIMEISLPLMEE